MIGEFVKSRLVNNVSLVKSFMRRLIRYYLYVGDASVICSTIVEMT